MSAGVYDIASDMTETLTGLSAGAGYLNAATVTYALKDELGTTIAGGTGSYTYTPASNGVYTASIESTVTTLLTVDKTYYLWVTIVSGAFNDQRRLPRLAKYREDT